MGKWYQMYVSGWIQHASIPPLPLLYTSPRCTSPDKATRPPFMLSPLLLPEIRTQKQPQWFSRSEDLPETILIIGLF